MSRTLLILCVLLALGCTRKPAHSPTTPAAGHETADTLTKTTESGPLKATVSLSPKSPQLGDQLTLLLSVEAAPNVSVEMPPFGEALGRFAIIGFTPRSETLSDGRTRHSQKYLLETPMSGRLRIPALRVEFSDRRPGPQPSDGGAADHELLTEELPVDIASVLPEGEVQGQLRGLRGPLPERFAPGAQLPYVLLALGGALLAGAWILIQQLRRRARLRAGVSAYDVAIARLRELQGRGFPRPEVADAWYVELSDTVRRYIEDRYGIRAPELTTEEFLREAKDLISLQPAHRELLAAFLSTCDRVKFAAYRPDETESQQALAEARSFIIDTRLVLVTRARTPRAEARP